MGEAKNYNLVGQGFHTHPDRINKKGRPKLPDLKEIMAEILGEEKDGKTALEAIVAKLRQLAAQGNIKAAEVLLSRGYGLPRQHVEHSGELTTINIQKTILSRPTEALPNPDPGE